MFGISSLRHSDIFSKHLYLDTSTFKGYTFDFENTIYYTPPTNDVRTFKSIDQFENSNSAISPFPPSLTWNAESQIPITANAPPANLQQTKKHIISVDKNLNAASTLIVAKSLQSNYSADPSYVVPPKFATQIRNTSGTFVEYNINNAFGENVVPTYRYQTTTINMYAGIKHLSVTGENSAICKVLVRDYAGRGLYYPHSAEWSGLYFIKDGSVVKKVNETEGGYTFISPVLTPFGAFNSASFQLSSWQISKQYDRFYDDDGEIQYQEIHNLPSAILHSTFSRNFTLIFLKHNGASTATFRVIKVNNITKAVTHQDLPYSVSTFNGACFINFRDSTDDYIAFKTTSTTAVIIDVNTLAEVPNSTFNYSPHLFYHGALA